MLRILTVVVALLTALLIGLLGLSTQSSVLTLLGVGAGVWAVTVAVLYLDAASSFGVAPGTA